MDSAYVANDILKHRGAWRREGWKRKGCTIRNADLWKRRDDLLDARGPASYKVTKAKGHATEEDVTKGPAAVTDKLGIDEAAALAVAGALRRFDPEPLLIVATAMRVQRMMVEIYAARAARSPRDQGTQLDSDRSSSTSDRSNSRSGSPHASPDFAWLLGC